MYLETYSSFGHVCTTVVYFVCVCLLLSRVQLFATLWAVAHQAPVSMEFSRQEYQSGLPFPSPRAVYLAAAKSFQTCPTLCDSIDGSPPGFPIPGILQARTLEWVAISFSNAWKWKVKVKSLSRVRLFATPWTVAYQAPPSMGFSRQEYWSGVPLPSPAVYLRELSNMNIFWKLLAGLELSSCIIYFSFFFPPEMMFHLFTEKEGD